MHYCRSLPENDELLHHVVGAIMGEFQVCRGVALVIGIAADAQMDVGIRFQNVGNIL